MRRTRFILTALLLMLPLLAGAQALMVSAAASLSNAFNELGPKFEDGKPGVTLRFNFGPSGVLLQQVAQGAPVDLLASADQATVVRGIAQKLLEADSARDFARNSLVLVVPAQAGADLRSLADLSAPGVKRIAIGKAATVPAGQYARESLASARLWPVLEGKLVFADNVRQVLDYVARGEVDAGFVYRSDAAVAAGKVRVALTAEGHTPVTYPAVVVSDSRNKPLARDFIAFLATPTALEVLVKHGFAKP